MLPNPKIKPPEKRSDISLPLDPPESSLSGNLEGKGVQLVPGDNMSPERGPGLNNNVSGGDAKTSRSLTWNIVTTRNSNHWLEKLAEVRI